jgi:formylmethanofuran dehydrogenase subunit E
VPSFNELLISSAEAHGHLCPGQVVGVRMAILGCRLIGFDAPPGKDQIKKLLVYVEMDRCAADAIAHVTRVRLGRRSLKFMDYGIMAATFVDLAQGQAFRIRSTEEARDVAAIYAPEVAGKYRQQLLGYQRMPERALFRVQQVQVEVSEFDLPGPSRREVVRDHREVFVDGTILCRPCAPGAYFRNARGITWPGMDQAPTSSLGTDSTDLGLLRTQRPSRPPVRVQGQVTEEAPTATRA